MYDTTSGNAGADILDPSIGSGSKNLETIASSNPEARQTRSPENFWTMPLGRIQDAISTVPGPLQMQNRGDFCF